MNKKGSESLSNLLEVTQYEADHLIEPFAFDISEYFVSILKTHVLVPMLCSKARQQSVSSILVALH